MPRPVRTPPRDRTVPSLDPFVGDRLEPGTDHDRVAFTELDLSGHDASDARFLECRFERCTVDELVLRRARIAESAFVDVHGVRVDLADATLRDCEVSGGRLGALALDGATLSSVRLRGTKIGFVSLTGAEVDDVTFEHCEIGIVDARIARLRRVRFTDCSIRELDVTGATLVTVDLSRADLRSLVGVESLRGAILGHRQLLDLAPLLAEELGIDVRPDAPADARDEAPGAASEV